MGWDEEQINHHTPEAKALQKQKSRTSHVGWVLTNVFVSRLGGPRNAWLPCLSLKARQRGPMKKGTPKWV